MAGELEADGGVGEFFDTLVLLILEMVAMVMVW